MTKGPCGSSPNLATTASPSAPAASLSLVSATLLKLLIDKHRKRYRWPKPVSDIFYPLAMTFLLLWIGNRQHTTTCLL